MNNIDKKWLEKYELAKKYYEENGNLQIHDRYKTLDGTNLGAWIHWQRQYYKNNKLSKEQIKLLEDINMIWQSYDFKWQEIYNLAKEYYKENNHLLIPYNYETENKIKIGLWISNQRQKYKKGKLSKEQIKLLEEINMVWIIYDYDNIWMNHYNLAKKYYEENGHLLISKKYEIKGINLGNWVGTQRQKYKKDELSKEQIDLLNDINMIWDPIEVQWQEMYELAKKYYEENKNLNIPNKFETKDGIKLGVWIQNQKQNYKNKKLSQEQIKLLNDIHIIWEPLSIQWQKKYELAKEYYKQNGHLLIFQKYEIKGIKLGAWIQIQRQKYKNNKLSKEQIDLLNDIDMIWDVYKIQWLEMYELVKEYYNENGHLLIPRYEIKDNKKIGSWISHQRNYYKKNKLSKEQIDLLNDIDMIWDASITTGNSFPEYLIYTYFKSIYGEDKVSYRDKSLGFELDVYIPSLKIAIEYDGQMHKSKKQKDENKNKLCEQNNITLYRFREKGLPILEENKFLKTIYIKDYSYEKIYKEIIKTFEFDIKCNIDKVYNEYAILTLDYLDSKWQEKYQLAKEYFKENGHLLIPCNYKIKGINLGTWLRNQRQNYKNKTLSKKRIELLEAIGIIWNNK